MAHMTTTTTSIWARWASLTTHELASLPRQQAVAILPVAATEQHGPHLPLSVDTELLDGILARAQMGWDGDFPVLVLPTQTVGFSPEHAKFAGTLTLSSATLIRLWTELADCVHASGIQKLLMFNSHGGQAGALDLVARDLRHRLGMQVASSSWYQLPLEEEMKAIDPHERRFGVHAGQVETSMMLALQPQSVQMSLAQNFPSSSEIRAKQTQVLGNGYSAKFAWQAQDLNPSGAVGNAVAASAEIGEAMLKKSAIGLIQLVKDLGGLPQGTLHG